MDLLADENIETEWIQSLRDDGHDVVRVVDFLIFRCAHTEYRARPCTVRPPKRLICLGLPQFDEVWVDQYPC